MAYELACRDTGMDCDFMVRSENEDEVVEMAREHMQNVHGQELSSDDARGMVQET